MSVTEKTFRIITLGCKVNQYESAYLQERLEEAGWHKVSNNDGADVIVINTCIVTGRASYQSRQAIRKAIRENRSARTAAIGCYAQVFPNELKDIKGLDIILDNNEKARLPELLLENGDPCATRVIAKDFEKDTPFEFLPVKWFANRTRAFLKIQDGCDSFCSYCIVPFARGPMRSLDPNQVLESLKSLSVNGNKEIVLTGVHLGRYGFDLGKGIDLKGLLRQIGKQRLPLRIRLSSLEPNEVDPELIDMMASEDWLCRHFHIPLQSGDNDILRSMKRNYTSEEVADIIHNIKDKMPLAAIGVDVMTGFPGEDDVSYGNTYSLINNLPVSYLHVFPFSPRAGTAAADFDGQVNHKLIKERAKELRNLGAEKRKIFYESCLGNEFSALTEGWHSSDMKMIKGLTDNYLRVIFPSDSPLENHMTKVRVLEYTKEGLICEPVSLI